MKKLGLGIGLGLGLGALSVILVGCGAGNEAGTPDRAAPGGGSSTEGPLGVVAGEGYTLGPGTSRLRDGSGTVTGTFGTPLCTTDGDAAIVIDDVTFETHPRSATGEGPSREAPAVEAWFRVTPPEDYPIVSNAGGPGNLSGEVTTLDEGPGSPIDHECDDGYLETTRTWPVVELLTVVTADSRGAVVTTTTIDYHVGERDFSLSFDWEVGHCGTALPGRFGCTAGGQGG